MTKIGRPCTRFWESFGPRDRIEAYIRSDTRVPLDYDPEEDEKCVKKRKPSVSKPHSPESLKRKYDRERTKIRKCRALDELSELSHSELQDLLFSLRVSESEFAKEAISLISSLISSGQLGRAESSPI